MWIYLGQVRGIKAAHSETEITFYNPLIKTILFTELYSINFNTQGKET